MRKLAAILVGSIFFIVLLITMPDYNIPWDARNHYFKGQDFANFFLYGRKNYQGLPITKDYARFHRDYVSNYSPDPNIKNRISKDPNFRRSIYQDDLHTFEWLMNSGQIEHPVFSDIASSFSNIVFYEKLGLLRDDFAYRVYTLLLAAVLVGVVFYWAFITYGWFPAMVSTLTLVTTPLFWAESHFSIKDVPQMAFFSLAVWQFWRGVTIRSQKGIVLSALFAGCAFATKLNIVFLPFILVPWFILYYLKLSKTDRQSYHRWWWIIIAYPIIMVGIVFLIWPQLWYRPIENFLAMIGMYYKVGVYPDYIPTFRTLFGFSTYAVVWTIYSTYPLVGLLTLVGIIFAIKNIRKTNDYFPLLLLFWVTVPIVRASLPFTTIYGGVRHIMEYIPAIALLSGYGVWNLQKLIPQRLKAVSGLIIILGFIPLIATLVRLHPAENVYFNSLIGGLSGAKKANITGWGYNDGGIYRIATTWLNQYAEKNSHVATAFSGPADFYIPELREDLLADNQFSGYLQKGEYIVALTHDTGLEHTYGMRYPEYFLEPVYVWTVDGVPLIKIWKNDKTHLKKEKQALKEQVLTLPVQIEDGQLTLDLGKVELITRIEIEFTESSSCQPISLAYLQISQDGENWEILPETYPGGPMELLEEQPKNGKLIAPIAGLPARLVTLTVEPEKTCLLNLTSSQVFILSK